jgi:ribosomal-protein-alanine N-acetyltransferase
VTFLKLSKQKRNIEAKTSIGNKELLFETERMIIREFISTDDVGMFELDSDKEVHKFLGNKPFTTIEESKNLIAFIQEQYIENGIGRWAILDKATDEFVGWTGFKWIKETINHHSNYYDFGYRLKRKFWGKGYATESGISALRYGIEMLQLKNIYAMTDANNFASRRVLEKIGMTYIETFDYDGELSWIAEGEPTTWYKKIIETD